MFIHFELSKVYFSISIDLNEHRLKVKQTLII